MFPRLLCTSALLLCVTGLGHSFQAGIQPIVEVKVKPQGSVFKDRAWNKPIVIKSAADAAKHFDMEALKILTQQVDFEKQFVLVFAWKGSGGDKLNFVVAESFPEQIFFSRQPGKTRDLREHTRVFALRSNVRWSAQDRKG